MKETTKYTLFLIISVILFGLSLAVYLVDGKLSFLIFSILSGLLTVGSSIGLYFEYKENRPINRKRKTKKRK